MSDCEHCRLYRLAHGGGSCPACAPPQAPVTAQVACTADGIGDALLGLTACAGLKARGETVHYALLGTSKKGAPWQLPWVGLFGGCDSASTSLIEGVPALYPHETYAAQNRTRLARPRWEHYAGACGTTARLPEIRPLPDDALAWAERYRGCVVLSPYSAYHQRAWHPGRWRELEALLSGAGERVVVIDGRAPAGGERTRGFAEALVDLPAAKVAALLRGASAFVGNDSGMSHLAGLLLAPALVLCGPARGERVFGLYPTARVLQGPLPCTGCHWEASAGWHRGCDTACADLQSITPAAVAAALREPPRTLLSADRLRVLSDTALRCASLPGDFAELGVYRGGSADAVARAAPGKRLHLFDTFAGIPEDDRDGEHRAGEFSCPLDDVKAHLAGRDVEFHAGTFPGTAAGLDGLRFAMVHLDGDTYQTTRAALEYFWPRLVDGGCLVLDDYGWRKCPGVERAVREVLPGVAVERTAFVQARLCKPPAAAAAPAKRAGGPGTELAKLLASLGVEKTAGCGCDARARQMDAWGVAGCRERRAEVVGWLKQEWDAAGFLARAKAGARALLGGLAPDWSDPLGWLLDEALRRAGA